MPERTDGLQPAEAPAPTGRALGREMACEGIMRTEFGAKPGASGSRAIARLRRRRVMRVVWPAAGLAAAAAALLVGINLWQAAAGRGVTVASGQVAEGAGAGAVTKIVPGHSYRAGQPGAQLNAPGGGQFELSGGSAFGLNGDGTLELTDGELVGRRLTRAGLRAGELRVQAEQASVAAMRRGGPGADAEAAVVALAGNVRTGDGPNVSALRAGQAVTRGWGVPERPMSIPELRGELERQRAGLEPRERQQQYHGIVGEYDARLEGFRRELAGAPAGSDAAAFLRERIDSLADCRTMHARRLARLDADADKHGKLDRRAGFLDRAERALKESSIAAQWPPESPADGGLIASVPPESGGRVRPGMAGR